MRIWSLHPRLLDPKGLVALWRETLLAKHVLLGNTKGYRNHPQLKRFKRQTDPLNAINYYLSVIQEYAEEIGYNFSVEKIGFFYPCKISVTRGQVEFELSHLKKKLETRNPGKLEKIQKAPIDVHPIFQIVDGAVEDWERI